MFRKLVSNLPFSPALVGQLGFYARRLKQEQTTRRIGLIFTALAVAMQSLAVFSPPEQALASGDADIIRGGVSSVQDILRVYDAGQKGQNDFKALMDYFGITRPQLAAMKSNVTICSSDKSIVSFGRQHNYSAAEGELVHKVPRATGGFSTFYSVPLHRFDSINNRVNCYKSFVGNSPAVGGWFSIMEKCGNFQIKKTIRQVPSGHLVTATCKTIQGYAYDQRQKDLKVKVYLFINGPPGKGKQYGPIVANQSTPTSPIGQGYGFNFSVPAEYQKSTTPTKVWAVLQPLPGWDQPTVQFDNQVQIPGNCTPAAQPVASCSGLQVNTIDRTRISLKADARAEQGAKIIAYEYSVTDKSGKKIYSKTISSTSTTQATEIFDIKNTGQYTANVIIKTSIGDKTATDCTKTLNISPPDKCKYNPDIFTNDPECQPCPYNNKIWRKDADCGPKISQSKEAKNITQSIANANGTTAKPSDRIEYAIYTTNLSDAATSANVTEVLRDVMQYATVLDAGGGIYNPETKTLSWGEIKIDAQKTDVRRFVVQVNPTIAATSRAANDPAAYNCVITNSYGNTIEINMECPVEKTVESTIKQLPSTGPGANIVFATIVVMTVTYFYLRSKQLNEEVKIVRKEFNAGTI